MIFTGILTVFIIVGRQQRERKWESVCLRERERETERQRERVRERECWSVCDRTREVCVCERERKRE